MLGERHNQARPYEQAFNEDRTRDLALTKRMLCQLSYRGEGQAHRVCCFDFIFCKTKTQNSETGNRTPGICVTGRDVTNYTISDHLEYLGFDPSTSCLLSTHASDCANTPMLPEKRQEQMAEARGAAKQKSKKTYSTRDSLVVPYQSTDRAQRCLTSQFGWDAVLSPWYDRMTMSL